MVDAALWGVLIVLCLVVVGLSSVVYQLMRQHGRLLLRLDSLEAGQAAASRGGQPIQLGHAHASGAIEPPELRKGTPFTPFALPDLQSRLVLLGDFKGRSLLIVHWSPECTFCRVIAADLAQLQGDLRRHNVQLLLLALDGPEANRVLAKEHGLECPILMESGIAVFDHVGTPAAYLLDDQGCVAAGRAVGAEQVLALARRAARVVKGRLSTERPLSESRIERNGLKPGTPAPRFTLPDLHGENLSLETYRGRPVLLVFSDPDCGPCNALAPKLSDLHQRHADGRLAFIVVSRGEPDHNRRKVEELRIGLPMIIQPGWRVSRQYGIFATPAAFLIDRDGYIAGDVAIGEHAILTLAEAVLHEDADPESADALR